MISRIPQTQIRHGYREANKCAYFVKVTSCEGDFIAFTSPPMDIACVLEADASGQIFLENNNKIQTISLVRKRFKLFWFLTTRVQRKQFLAYKIEYVLLDFPILPVFEVGPNMPEIEFIELVL